MPNIRGMLPIAVVLAEYSNEPIDVARVIRMLLVHDIVEVDAGDTFASTQSATWTRLNGNRQLRDRIFGLLPDDQTRGTTWAVGRI